MNTPLKVLVAEDNEVNRRVIIKMLQKLGFEADVVLTGREAVAAAAQRPYAAILMDCRMPEMDGFEATARIRKMTSAVAMIPIIAITANAFREDREACLAAGMTDYVAKPIQMNALRAVLSQHIPNHTQTDAKSPGPTAAVSGQDVLNSAAINQLLTLGQNASDESVEMDQSFFLELVAAFEKVTPPTITSLHDAMRRGDATILAKMAHKLKGSCFHMGAQRLAELTRRIEESAMAQRTHECAPWVESLDSEYDLARRALAQVTTPKRAAHLPGGPQVAA